MQSAVLGLARGVRSAETIRIARGKEALERYDGTLHTRFNSAVAYLRAVKKADDEYNRNMEDALGQYALSLRSAASA